jgi:hypothetical protein
MICKGGAEDLDKEISWRHLEANFDATANLAPTPQDNPSTAHFQRAGTTVDPRSKGK